MRHAINDDPRKHHTLIITTNTRILPLIQTQRQQKSQKNHQRKPPPDPSTKRRRVSSSPRFWLTAASETLACDGTGAAGPAIRCARSNLFFFTYRRHCWRATRRACRVSYKICISYRALLVGRSQPRSKQDACLANSCKAHEGTMKWSRGGRELWSGSEEGLIL